MEPTMDLEQSVTDILDQNTSALAGATIEEMATQSKEGKEATEDDFRWWHAFLESRVNDLAAAIDVGQPRLFVSQVRWCRAGMQARDVSGKIIQAALTALRQVIQTELGTKADEIAKSYLDAAINDFDKNVTLPETTLDVSTPRGRLTAEYVLALLEGRRLEAMSKVRNAVDDGLSVKDACIQVLIPAVREIGRMWHMNEVSIAEEHFASDTTQSLIAQLQVMAPKAVSNGKTILAASVAGNRHDMGIRIVSNLFEINGWRVICLGGDMPGMDVAQAVVDFDADMLLLSATLHTQLRAVERTIALVRAQSNQHPIKILVGGLGFDLAPELVRPFGADGHACTIDEAIELGRTWFPLNDESTES
jgi:methanogenic corrinoid protein MtbC1